MAEGTTAPPPKKDVARALLLRGNLFVWLDPRREGVRVPLQFAQQPELVLQVGLDMPIPIPDLRVDDLGVHGTLSFQRSPFPCFVPWDAVFALADDHGHGRVWIETVPSEIAAEIELSGGGEAVRRRPARPAKDEAKARPAKDEAKARPAKDEAKARPAKDEAKARPRLAPAVAAARLAEAPPPNPAPEPVAMRAIEGGASGGPRPETARKKGSRELPPYLRVVK